MERLELSQPKLLEPKPSASTNSATFATLLKIFEDKSLRKNKSFNIEHI